MLNPKFLMREMVEAKNQALVFLLCVALSITTLVALNSFSTDVNRTITGDARALHGADLILHSHYEFSPVLLAAVNQLDAKVSGRVRTWEFYSVVRNPAQGDTVLSNIKVVGHTYPLYGKVELATGEDFQQTLQPGKVVVGQELLTRLNLAVGDTLGVGKAALQIVDVVTHESSRPVDFFQFGPRVFVAAADLDRIDLVRGGSRVEYELLLKVTDEEELASAEEQLKRVAIAGQERVRTYQTARSGLKRFFDNLLFFLSLISIFTLLLAGIGMQSSLSALLRQKEKSLAIVKALGATRAFLYLHYILLVCIYGGIGSLLGIFLAKMVKMVLPALFSGLLPEGSIGGLAAADVLEGLVLGFLVVTFFTCLPLYRLQDVKPNVIFRSETGGTRKSWLYYLVLSAGLLFVTLLVIRQLADVKTGLYFMGGTIGLILIISVLATLILTMLKKSRVPQLAFRQSVRSLLRPGNSTRPIIVTLASALSVLLVIFLVEHNLHRTYVESYPEDAPNLFLVDIQPDQRQGVAEMVGGEVELHPIIRARLKAINDIQIRRGERSRWRDSLTREFNLTYRDYLLADELLVEGNSLYEADENGEIVSQVSVLDMVAELGDIKKGDRLEFNIQGVPLVAEVSSIRSRTRSMLYPFFYFVFPKQYLEKAPQTLFAAVHVEKSRLGPLERDIVARYPNISVINMAQAATELGAVMTKLSGIVNFFSLFSILAGGLIIISSILATRMARVREAVYYKVLGAHSRFVIRVFFFENILLGLISSFLAVLLAQIGSWALCKYLFEIDYMPNVVASVTLVVLTVSLVVAVGMLSSLGIIRLKPITFLREQTVE